jgi:micrococcal nuclease
LAPPQLVLGDHSAFYASIMLLAQVFIACIAMNNVANFQMIAAGSSSQRLPVRRIGDAARVALLVCVAVLAAAASAHASARHAASAGLADWWGTVTYVVDGDTLYVRPLEGGKPVSVRIDGIDAPEICQAGGAAAREVLRQRVLGQQVRVQAKAHDRYSRLVAGIVKGNVDQGAEMVATGQAWAYRYEVGRGPYASLQRRAEAAQLGLFSFGSYPQTPAAFRKMHGSCR